MFEYIRGRLVEKSPDKVIIDINGVGFKIFIPLSTYEKLPDIDEEVMVRVYLNVRDDLLELFGFFSSQELALFRNLISVSKVGPRLALNILSCISIEQFVKAIENKDVGKLTAISGIGKKTAQRIILELSGRLVLEEVPEGIEDIKGKEVLEAAVSALMNLGLTRSEAINAIKSTGIKIDKSTKLEELIKESLKKLRTK